MLNPYLMQINGNDILWKDLWTLYDAQDEQRSVYIEETHKEHLHQTFYGKMKVNLAAQVVLRMNFFMIQYTAPHACMQVLSESVANSPEFYGDPATTETHAAVCEDIRQILRLSNLRCPDEHFQRWKDNLKPYSSPTDARLKVITLHLAKCMCNNSQWLEEDFLGYLTE